MITLAAPILLALNCLQEPETTVGADALAPFGAVPNEHQLAWHDRTFYAFVHFGPNTFTGVEWGEGREDPKVFAPSDFDAKSWARAFKTAGMTGVVITAKHHDGFCLWPSDVTTHDVASSDWLDGTGDVLQALSDACREEGLWFGVYLSPWDKHEATYGTGDPYNEHFATQLTEALTRYGTISEVWFDGANGEGPNGKRQTYDWERFVGVVREHQPGAVIFSDAGPDIRWCGNERAIGNETNWATLRRDEITLGTSKVDELNRGHEGGTHWVPYECNTSIRPGWFWREGLDGEVKSLEQLLDTWYASVGRGGNFLLNVPPDNRGRITDVDARRIAQLGTVLQATHGRDLLREAMDLQGGEAASSNVRGGADSMGPSSLLNPGRDSYWAVDDDHDADGKCLAWAEFVLPRDVTFDEVWLEEPIQLGQRVKRFRVQVGSEGGEWRDLGAGTTIGARRILRVGLTQASRIRVLIDSALATPALSRLSLFLSPPKVEIDPPSGVAVNPIPVRLSSREGTQIRFTLDGSEVTLGSPQYDGSLLVDSSATLRARAFSSDRAGPQASPFVAQGTYQILQESDWLVPVAFIRPPDPGLSVKVYEGGWQTLDQMTERDPIGRKKAMSFDLGLVTRQEQCALEFTGYLSVPQDGLYTLALVSDDGSRFYVGGTLVVDNDGLHGAVRAEGRVALKAGYHPMAVQWFNSRGSSSLEVRWSGPGVGRDQAIPSSVLFR
jgi:alpha-L-fucosidase